MARTKQTARRSCVVKAPRRRMSNLGTGMIVEEPKKNANTDQFSLRFDDQEKC